jgi:arylsulfatase A-like enzyme
VVTAATQLPQDAYCDDWIGACGIDLVREGARSGRPWFLQVNFTGPHEPMDITVAMAGRVADRMPPLPAALGGLDADTHLGIRRNYTAMIENIDDIVGRFVEALRASGQLEDTVIIFSSDHGEMLGDCGLWEKFVPHQASLHVPLVIAGPGIAAGRRVDAPTTILDLHATIIDFAEAEPLPDVDTRSLLPVLADPSRPHRSVVFAGLGQWRIAYDGRFKLVAGFDPATPRSVMEAGDFDPEDRSCWRLVEPDADPCEVEDVSGRYPDVADRLTMALVENTLHRTAAAQGIS